MCRRRKTRRHKHRDTSLNKYKVDRSATYELDLIKVRKIGQVSATRPLPVRHRWQTWHQKWFTSLWNKIYIYDTCHRINWFDIRKCHLWHHKAKLISWWLWKSFSWDEQIHWSMNIHSKPDRHHPCNHETLSLTDCSIITRISCNLTTGVVSEMTEVVHRFDCHSRDVVIPFPRSAYYVIG
jgi:hypothetical protein